MRKKFIVTIFTLLLSVGLISGCSSEKEYKRDTSKGNITQIHLADMEEKIKNKDTFVIVFATHTCGYCQAFHNWLPNYLENHNIEVVNIYLDEETTTVNENRRIVNKYFEEFNATPGIFYVKEGENASYLENQSDGINEEYFDKWVEDNQIDNKNK